jgi:hypothetical protein
LKGREAKIVRFIGHAAENFENLKRREAKIVRFIGRAAEIF